ncbi:hypothetical protein Slin14017_G114210 [Septoria linicola]|nr:hypothetical protein Slin14017_G114210 [Septoria linicola]
MTGLRIAAVAASLACLVAAQTAPAPPITSSRAPFPFSNSSIPTTSSSSLVISSSVVPVIPEPSVVELKCPESNNTEYTASSGARFLIECELDHYGGDMAMESTTSFQQCIDFCDRRSGCVDVSYQGSACYMKASVGSPIYSKTVLGARLLSPPAGAPAVPVCPASNGANYTTAGNKTFLVECGIDYTSGRNEDNLAVIDVNPSKGSGELWFQRCIEACGATTSCVDISLSGSACYLKSSIASATRIENPDIFGARLIDPVPSSPPRPSTSATPAAPPQSATPVSPPQSTSTAVECPAANGTTYVAGSGGSSKSFVIECGIDYASTVNDLIGGPRTLPGTSGELWLSQYIDICANTTDCVNIALSGAACYLKSNINGRNAVQSKPEFGGARLLPSGLPSANSTSAVASPTPAVPTGSVRTGSILVTSRTSTLAVRTTTSSAVTATSSSPVCAINTTPQCPACNGRTMSFEDELYSEDGYRGAVYRVRCGLEYVGGNLGDSISSSGARGFRFCVDTCFYTEGCVAVAFSGSVCQLKDSISGGTRANAAIWGAVDLDAF